VELTASGDFSKEMIDPQKQAKLRCFTAGAKRRRAIEADED
jgi:hypothetical protein